jgi:ferric-dicitrate binding protein FerR (iron transport regulator)
VAFVPKTASESGPFEVVLSPGEYISYEWESGKISHGCFSADDFSLWRQGGLYFKNKTLGEIVRQLERKYNVTIVITSPELKELRYHMAFVNNESIEQILDFIDQDSKIDIIRHGNIVELF